jgi:uncharacterized repeat protein (TIGR04076 family)
MENSVRVTVEAVEGVCHAGMKAGDYFIVRDVGPMVLENSEGWCAELVHNAFPTCMTFAGGGSLRWEDKDGAARLACPDPDGRVIVRIERM